MQRERSHDGLRLVLYLRCRPARDSRLPLRQSIRHCRSHGNAGVNSASNRRPLVVRCNSPRRRDDTTALWPLRWRGRSEPTSPLSLQSSRAGSASRHARSRRGATGCCAVAIAQRTRIASDGANRTATLRAAGVGRREDGAELRHRIGKPGEPGSADHQRAGRDQWDLGLAARPLVTTRLRRTRIEAFGHSGPNSVVFAVSAPSERTMALNSQQEEQRPAPSHAEPSLRREGYSSAEAPGSDSRRLPNRSIASRCSRPP
jgi:hypothetical protein